jgi:hypothetical protein
MRYFDVAARQHHEDEEQDLYPALLESMAGSDAICLRQVGFHRALSEHHCEIALIGRQRPEIERARLIEVTAREFPFRRKVVSR